MTGRAVSGIMDFRWRTNVPSIAEAVVSKEQYRYLAGMLVFILFLLGSVFSFPLCAAAEMDARKAAIAAGVAAGTDISVIIKDAVAAGMTPQQAVEELVAAGADPGRVVYEAITAKYSSEAVIKGASTAVNQKFCTNPDETPCSTGVNAIITAATQAGESQTTVQGWIASAGISANVIANAGSSGSQNGGTKAPVEAYSPPGAPPALTSIIGGGGGSIGGSGIGSTKKASNSNP